MAAPSSVRLPAAYYIPQDQFIDEYLDLKPGQHVSLFGPNGVGKTTIGLKILGKATDLNPQTVGIALAMKPDKGPREDGQKRRPTGDETVAALSRTLGGRVTRTWRPPLWQRLIGEPRFWTLWPRHSEEFRADLARHRAIFERAILESYNKGNRWIFADEVFSLVNELRLADELTHVWSKGRSMKCAIIGATQRPAFVPKWMYSSARHLLLWKDNDLDARKRYGEISGVDPKRVLAVTSGLRHQECLYLYPEADTWAILTPTPNPVTNSSRSRAA